jgi:hypothetical protein
MIVLTSVTVLFVQRNAGLGHQLEESATKQDVGVAIEVMRRFLGLVTEVHQT